MKIPKIIHQTYASRALPDVIFSNIEFLKKNNPGWDYRFYTDDDILQFIGREYQPSILKAYLRINPKYGAARADFFRYLLMYRMGGVYLDIKSTAVKKLDEVVAADDEYLLSHWPNGEGEMYENWGMPGGGIENFPIFGEFQNWHIICRPSHPFLHHVIGLVLRLVDSYDVSKLGVGLTGVIATTGPVPYSIAINKVLRQYSCRVLRSHLDIGLRYSLYDGDGVIAHRGLFKNHYSSLQEPIVLARV